VRNLRTVRVAYWVNVSESSGTSSPGLSEMKGHETVKRWLCDCHAHSLVHTVALSLYSYYMQANDDDDDDYYYYDSFCEVALFVVCVMLLEW